MKIESYINKKRKKSPRPPFYFPKQLHGSFLSVPKNLAEFSGNSCHGVNVL